MKHPTRGRIDPEAAEVMADMAQLSDAEVQGTILAGLRVIAERTDARQAARLALGLA